MAIVDRRRFILEHARLQPPPHVPEIRLHLADEETSLWRLSQEALEDLGLPAPFWAFAWAGGQALARFILDNPMEVKDLNVLDFATGSGLAAIAAKICGARRVLAADIDPFSALAVALNCQANGQMVEFIGDDLLDQEPPEADLIMAGDVFYDQPMAARVSPWLAFAHRRGSRILVGDPGRGYLPKSMLTQLAEYRVPTHRELEDQEVRCTGVFTLA